MRLMAMIQKNVGLAKRNPTNHGYASIQVTFGRRRYACLPYGLNFTPVPRENYRIGVPKAGMYRELLNSDSIFYSGSNVNNGEGVATDEQPWMDQPYSMVITLPPLAGVVFAIK